MTIRDLLGHRCITSTQVYLHMTVDDLRHATDMHPVGEMLEKVMHLLPDLANVKLPVQHPKGTKKFG